MMRVIKLKAENIKKLVAVEISPKGDVITITGKNGAGKSSVLDSIFYALTGKLPENPIRTGQDKAKVVVDLERYIVTKTITQSGSSLKVEGKNGEVFKSPQKLLDGLIGELCFDPLEFSRLEPKEQRKILMDLLKLDLSELDRRKEEALRQRLLAVNAVKVAQAKLNEAFQESPRELPADLPEKPINVSEVIEKSNKLSGLINALNLQEAEASSLEEAIERNQAEIRELEGSINDLKEEILLKGRKLDELRTNLRALPKAQEEWTEHDKYASKVSATNALIALRERRRQADEALTAAVDEREQISKAIDEIEGQRRKAIESAPMPLAGLSFSEDIVLFNGIPFEQLSSAEQLKVSLAMAMAMNPEIRVIRITDGSLLDKANLEIIQSMARTNDFQIWIEKVDETEKIGIVIEEGQIKAEN